MGASTLDIIYTQLALQMIVRNVYVASGSCCSGHLGRLQEPLSGSSRKRCAFLVSVGPLVTGQLHTWH